MTALTKGRITAQIGTPDAINGSAAAAAFIHQGAIVIRDAAGNLTQGATATGAVGVGRARYGADNAAGSAGAVRVDVDQGIFHYDNSAAADEITAGDIGALCFIVDDQTVAKTDGSNTRSPAGVIHDVDANGVWVRFDAALTRAYTA